MWRTVKLHPYLLHFYTVEVGKTTVDLVSKMGVFNFFTLFFKSLPECLLAVAAEVVVVHVMEVH